MARRLTLPVPRCEDMSRTGFTLLESLIALAVVAMAVTLLARTHVQTLRAEGMGQALEGARVRMETVVSSIMLGQDPRAVLEESLADGWALRMEPVPGGSGSTVWQAWTIAASNLPAVGLTVHLRVRE